MVGQGAGRGETVLHAQPAAGLVEVGVNGVLGDVQFAGDLLGRKMTVDQPQALALTRGELIERVWSPLTHGLRLPSLSRRRPLGLSGADSRRNRLPVEGRQSQPRRRIQTRGTIMTRSIAKRTAG